MIKNILNLGDAAVYCDFGKEVNQDINSNVISTLCHPSDLIQESCLEDDNSFAGHTMISKKVSDLGKTKSFPDINF